jgi:peptidoglycan/xylan/chitin deacetylase (PgdA/CDA1 family)
MVSDGAFEWPDGHRGALCLTFDNLGEASAVELGAWGDRPLGQHYTAPFVDKLIAALGETRATYFIEGVNAKIYPNEIRAWADAGLEVGLHAWRHEAWTQLPSETRVELLQRSQDAMAKIGVEPVGFRPPGDAASPEVWAELEAAGFSYCSDAGPGGIRKVGNLVALPFEWNLVDAYVLEAITAPMRLRYGGQAEPRSISEWRDQLNTALEAAVANQACATVIFHPMFMAVAPEKFDALRWLIGRAGELGVWTTSAQEIAQHVAKSRLPQC